MPRDTTTRHHVLIAGTGRAGTSFLVRYLTECGLETQLTHGEAGADWDDRAQAGFENLPDAHRSLPYVLKSPWAHQDIEALLADPALHFDAVILPMRDLIEAACSRTIIETQAVHAAQHSMAERQRSWLLCGHTPGGAVFSLDPLDQARLLAMGFHHLLHRLVAADVPVIMLDFPRLVADPAYLFAKLAPLLPPTLSAADAARAHARLVNAASLRTGGEVRAITVTKGMPDGPGFDALDRAALAREVQRLRTALAGAEAAQAVTHSFAWRVALSLRVLARRWPRLARLAVALLRSRLA